MKIVALDPSVNNVGWAVYDSDKTDKAAWSWGTWKLGGNNYQMRLVDLRDRMADEIGELHVLVTEWPSFHSSEKGKIAAHMNYTIDLAGICAFIAAAYNLDHKTWYNVTASQWKGTVAKEITQRRFFRVFKTQLAATSEHAIDAVMLLRYWLQTFGEQVFATVREPWKENLLLQD